MGADVDDAVALYFLPELLTPVDIMHTISHTAPNATIMTMDRRSTFARNSITHPQLPALFGKTDAAISTSLTEPPWSFVRGILGHAWSTRIDIARQPIVRWSGLFAAACRVRSLHHPPHGPQVGGRGLARGRGRSAYGYWPYLRSKTKVSIAYVPAPAPATPRFCRSPHHEDLDGYSLVFTLSRKI